MDFSKVRNFNMFCDSYLENINQGLCRRNDCTIINMNKHNDQFLSTSSKENGLVDFALCKAQVSDHDFHQSLIPTSVGLFKAIQGFSKPTNLFWGANTVTRRLFHEDGLIEGEYSIQVGPFDVNLVYFIVVYGCN
jgi:hypothetical protein